MNNLKLLFLAIVSTTIVGCYDDTVIKEDISDLKDRVSKLEALCTQINTNLVGIQTLVNSLNNNDYITSVTPIKGGEETIGYTITFLKGAPITIYNGKNGKDGDNGITPQIGVKQDTDGIWYWTLGDDWLLDDNGEKVRASGIKGDKGEDGTDGSNGKDAVAPQLKIEGGYWYLSTDNGKTWTNIGKATGDDGKDGDSMFKSVTYDDKYAYFTLVNGTILTVPLSTSIPKLQFTLDKEKDFHLAGGETIVLNYSITSPTGASTTFTSYENANWKVQIQKTSSTKGTISITAPNPVESGKILLVLSDDYGNVFMKTLEITGDDNVIKIIKTEYTIDEYGGYIDVAVDANLGFIVQILDDGKSWINVLTTGPTTRLSISPNSDYSSRSATVRFKGNDGETYKDIIVTQLQNNAIVVTSNSISVSDFAQTYDLIIRANIDCKLSIPGGNNWISDITTKGLTDKVFTLSFTENSDYSSRSVDVVVSDLSGILKQTITITQSGYTPVYVSIPDATFLACLVENYDINGDGLIDQKEAVNVTDIDCSGKAISSLTGIGSFVNLAKLDCSKTQITSLDLSANTKLEIILCQYNELLEDLSLPPLNKIISRAFLNCTALKELDIPKTVTSIGEDAFMNCSSLTKMTIRSDIGTTFSNSFRGASLESLLITENASTIKDNMFSGSPIKRVRIEGNVETIGYGAFGYCKQLENVSIGESVSVINSRGFWNCGELKEVVFDKYSKLREFHAAFHGCVNLALLDMSYCTELTYIYTREKYDNSYLVFAEQHGDSPNLVIKLGARTPPTPPTDSYYSINSKEYDSSSYLYSYFKYTLFVPSDCIDKYKDSKTWYKEPYVTIMPL